MYFLEFELTYNTWTDLTADWQTRTPLVIERGITPGERSARPGSMRLALYNPDGRYTPGHADCTPGFDAGIGVRLRASDGVDIGAGYAANPLNRLDPMGTVSSLRNAALDDLTPSPLGRVLQSPEKK